MSKDDPAKSAMPLSSKLRIAGISIAAILLLVVVLQNTEAVETKLLFITITVPRAALLFGTTVVGYVLGIFTASRFARGLFSATRQ